MVGAIGFEPSAPQQLVVITGLGWQPKDRKRSQRNNYWTRIGHCCLLRVTTALQRFSRTTHNQIVSGKGLTRDARCVEGTPIRLKTDKGSKQRSQQRCKARTKAGEHR